MLNRRSKYVRNNFYTKERKNNNVEYKRGYMNFKTYYNDIKNYIGKYNLLLHLRISTGGGINPLNTHPYKKGNVKQIEGKTKQPVICMNGVISFYNCSNSNLNDTANYIIEHQDAFKVINKDILNIIGEATGSKWAAMLPDKIYLTSDFIKDEGIYYSNLNHRTRSSFYNLLYDDEPAPNIKNYIKNRKLRKAINKDKELKQDLQDYITYHCSVWDCTECYKNCIYDAKTVYDLYDLINQQYLYNY
jgi:predicted glutamine amidotransferase